MIDEFFHATSSNPAQRSFAGKIYECKLVRHWRKKKGYVSLKVYQRRHNQLSESTWIFEHEGNPTTVNVRLEDVVHSAMPCRMKQQDNVLYRPVKANYPGLDAIIRDESKQRYYGIQATVAASHGTSRKILDKLRRQT